VPEISLVYPAEASAPTSTHTDRQETSQMHDHCSVHHHSRAVCVSRLCGRLMTAEARAGLTQ